MPRSTARIFHEARGQGPALVLPHGCPLSGALFAGMRDTLERDFTAVTVDHRGYSKSKATQNPGTVERYAKDAIAVLDKLGIRHAAVGGLFMGGPIVFEMFRRAPDRFSSMILIDTIAAPVSHVEAGIWQGSQERIEEKGVEGIIPFLMRQMPTVESAEAISKFLKRQRPGWRTSTTWRCSHRRLVHPGRSRRLRDRDRERSGAGRPAGRLTRFLRASKRPRDPVAGASCVPGFSDRRGGPAARGRRGRDAGPPGPAGRRRCGPAFPRGWQRAAPAPRP